MAPLQETERQQRSGKSSTIAIRHVLLSSRRSCPWRAGMSKSAIPLSPTACSTAWCTMPIASRCAESPCARNAIRPRTRRRNEPKPTSLSASWRFHANNPRKFTRTTSTSPEASVTTARTRIDGRQLEHSPTPVLPTLMSAAIPSGAIQVASRIEDETGGKRAASVCAVAEAI